MQTFRVIKRKTYPDEREREREGGLRLDSPEEEKKCMCVCVRVYVCVGKRFGSGSRKHMHTHICTDKDMRGVDMCANLGKSDKLSVEAGLSPPFLEEIHMARFEIERSRLIGGGRFFCDDPFVSRQVRVDLLIFRTLRVSSPSCVFSVTYEC